MAAEPARLQSNALGLADVVFQGVTHIAPATSVVFALPVVAKEAGPAMPLSMLLAVIVCLFIANTVAQFAHYVPSSGGYYTFVSRGLGPRFGFLTTWSYLIYDIVGPASAIGALGAIVAGFLDKGAGIFIPWWVIAVVAAGAVWFLTYRGIRFSTHATIILGAVEILIMIAFGVSCLLHPASESSSLAPLDPAAAPKGWGGVLGGMLFCILALTGFEAPAPLAQETRRPAKFIAQAIFTSLLIVGFFFIFMAYASAIGWGTADMRSFAGDLPEQADADASRNPFYQLAEKLWGPAWWLLLFAIVNGTIAVAISGTNAASRVLYTMAQAGTMPSALATIHPVHKTPATAIHVQQILQITAFLLCGFLIAPGAIFDFLGTITTLGVIVLYVCANFALTFFICREHAADFHFWRHVALPAAGTLLLIPAVFVQLWPPPGYPLALTPYLFLGLMVLGFVVMVVIERRRPQALAQGSALLISTVATERSPERAI